MRLCLHCDQRSCRKCDRKDELEKLPDTPVSVNVTVPVGVSGLPAVELSTTTTVHCAGWFTTTWVEHATVVVVVR